MVEATINGREFRPEHMEVEFKVRPEDIDYKTAVVPEVPHRLIIFTDQKDTIAKFCKAGDTVEIRWERDNESASLAQNKMVCLFEGSRLSSESGVKLTASDRMLLESAWRIISWEIRVNNTINRRK
jgi:hypothetical protein